jgi:hypothetical protein
VLGRDRPGSAPQTSAVLEPLATSSVSRLAVGHDRRPEWAADVDGLRLRVSAGIRPASPTRWHSVVRRHSARRQDPAEHTPPAAST